MFEVPHRNPSRTIPRACMCGFTLIELLVVISIIALLISILLPALGSAREAAKRAVGQSNQRQIMIATMGFETEIGNLPYPRRGTNGNTANLGTSNFLKSWQGGWSNYPDQTNQTRIWADELVDFGFITTETFDDPQHIQKVGTPDGRQEFTAQPETQRTVNGQLLAPRSYGINHFFQASSLDQERHEKASYTGTNSLWKGAQDGVNQMFNKMTAEVFSAPALNMYIGDAAISNTNPGVVWPHWDDGERDDDKLFGFADGHVEMVPQVEWWANTFWGSYDPSAEDPRFRARLWDIKHSNPLGGGWQDLDINHY